MDARDSHALQQVPQISLTENVGSEITSQPSASDDVNGNVIGSLPSIQSWYSLLPGDVDWKSSVEVAGDDNKDVLGVIVKNQQTQPVHNNAANSTAIDFDSVRWSYEHQYHMQQQLQLQQQRQQWQYELMQQQMSYVTQVQGMPPYVGRDGVLEASDDTMQTPSFVSIGSHPDVVDMLKRGMENEPAVPLHGNQLMNQNGKKVVTTVSTQTTPQHEEPRQTGSSRSQCRFLYEFLEFLLANATYRSLIQWRNKERRIFTLVDHHRVAELWGLHKRKKGMCYEKFSRALRFYYRKNILRKEPGRFTYRFVNGTNV